MYKRFITIFFFIVFLSFGLSQAQDPGIADTIRLANISGEIGTRTSMPVYLYNDEELTSVVIPLVIDGYSGWLKFDSISYSDSRLTDPAILDNRLTYVFASDTFTVDSLLLSFSLSSGNNLPSGSGKLCDLWFTLHFGGWVLLDSLSTSPQGGLSLTNASKGSFTPQFLSGSIAIACNYLVGDVTRDDVVNAGDIVMHHKIYFYDETWSGYPVQDRAGRFDLNCDRRLDLRDLVYLTDMLFHPPLPACTCGTVNPPLYDEPGFPDTVWIQSETLIVGIPSTILVGVTSDEPITGLAVNLEWDGFAKLGVDNQNCKFTEEIDSIFWGTKVHHAYTNAGNPDTFQFYAWRNTTESVSLPPGRTPIISIALTPMWAGTADFRLANWHNRSQSMLTTENHKAILPVLSGGHVIVLAYLPGDATQDGKVDVADVVYLINYLYKNGPIPLPQDAADANCDGSIDIGDVIYLINYLFKGGPAPSCWLVNGQ